MLETKESFPILSICIPTFGGGDRLNKGIQRVLSYKGDDIEIIVSDNDKSSDLGSVIDDFCDTRVKYYTNEQNYGPFYNWIKVLTYGTGKYLMTLNDNDWVIPENIYELIDFLNREETGVIVSSPPYIGKIKYTHGASNGYSCTGIETHPSCFILKREKFCEINDVINIKDMVTAYVQCTLALICSMNDRVCINRKIPIFEMPDKDYYISHNPRSTNEISKAKGGFYYTPAGAFEMLKGYIEVYKCFAKDKMERAIPYLYRAQLKRATIEYKNCSSSEIMTMRYKLPYRTDIDINKERKDFYKIVKEWLSKEQYGFKVCLIVWLFTVRDKWKTDFDIFLDWINERMAYCLQKYAWAKLFQKIWRKLNK